MDGLIRHFNGAGFRFMQQREQRLCESGQIPLGDRGLVCVSVTSVLIDGAELRGGIIGVHESTGAVIDRLSAQRHVVRIHYAMDEADVHPLGNQTRLTFDDGVKQREIRMLGRRQLWIMPLNGIIGERLQSHLILMRRRPFESAHPNMAGRHARQHCARQRRLPIHQLTRRHHRETSRGGNAERVHGFTDEILPQHGSQCGPAISAP